MRPHVILVDVSEVPLTCGIIVLKIAQRLNAFMMPVCIHWAMVKKTRYVYEFNF